MPLVIIVYPLSLPGYIRLPNANYFRQLFCCSIFSQWTEAYPPGGWVNPVKYSPDIFSECTVLRCVLAKCYEEGFCFLNPHWPDLKVSSLHCFMSCLKGSSTVISSVLCSLHSPSLPLALSLNLVTCPPSLSSSPSYLCTLTECRILIRTNKETNK